MEKLKDRIKSKIKYNWTEDNQKDFNELKQLLVKHCEKGVYRLTSQTDSPLLLISYWSKAESGFTLNEVTCEDPQKWDNESTRVLCCPDKCWCFTAGCWFNNDTDACYVPSKGKLLEIASALHKSYFQLVVGIDPDNKDKMFKTLREYFI